MVSVRGCLRWVTIGDDREVAITGDNPFGSTDDDRRADEEAIHASLIGR